LAVKIALALGEVKEEEIGILDFLEHKVNPNFEVET